MAEIKVRGESRITLIPIYRINENISFPMRTYTKQQIIPLAESISHNGIIQPLIVRKNSSYSYELICGKRRLQAAVMAGKREVPCIILHCSRIRSLLFSLAENYHRYEYTYIEELRIINTLIEDYRYTIEDISELLGKREKEIKSLLQLNIFGSSELLKIEKHRIDIEISLLLSTIKSEDKRIELLNKVIREGLSYSQINEFIKSNSEQKKIIIKDVKIFHNSIIKILNTMKLSGLDTFDKITENEKYIQYVIRIPK